eukprot:694416-Amorphochlora_amoeboformis.AAC.1
MVRERERGEGKKGKKLREIMRAAEEEGWIFCVCVYVCVCLCKCEEGGEETEGWREGALYM